MESSWALESHRSPNTLSQALHPHQGVYTLQRGHVSPDGTNTSKSLAPSLASSHLTQNHPGGKGGPWAAAQLLQPWWWHVAQEQCHPSHPLEATSPPTLARKACWLGMDNAGPC